MRFLEDEKRTDIQAIRAGWLMDGLGAAIRQNVFIFIRDGVIRSISETLPPDLSPDACIDLSDCTILPPLADCHVHLTLSGSLDPRVRAAEKALDEAGMDALIASNLLAHRRYGVFTVRDGGDLSGATLRRRNEGALPRVKAAGPAWYREGMYGSAFGRPVPKGNDFREAFSSIPPDADHIKIFQSGINSLTEFGKETPPQFTKDELAGGVAFAKSRHLGVMVHANGVLPVAEALAAGCDSIEHGFFMGEENLKRMADSEVIWVPTLAAMKTYADHAPPGSIQGEVAQKTLEHQLEQLRKAREYGVVVAAGTDAGTPGVMHGRALWEELALLMAAGYRPEEATTCAVRNASRLLRQEAPILAVGEPATVIAVPGAPNAALRSFPGIEAIILSGRYMDAT